MSGVDPEITLNQDGPFCYRAQVEYTADTLDAMARRAAERIEDELVQQLLARLGYVKPVRCRDCERQWVFDLSGMYETHEHDQMYCALLAGHSRLVMPDGYCAWGVRKEGTE